MTCKANANAKEANEQHVTESHWYSRGGGDQGRRKKRKTKKGNANENNDKLKMIRFASSSMKCSQFGSPIPDPQVPPTAAVESGKMRAILRILLITSHNLAQD